MNLIKEVSYSCPLCEKIHKVKVCEEETKALIRNRPVEYNEIYYLCPESNEEFYPEKVLYENLTKARDTYKRLNGLLTSSEIREIRRYYSLNQREFSNLFGWGDITVQRYESNAIQDETYDEVLRRAKDDPMFVYSELKKHKDKFSDDRSIELELFLKNEVKKKQAIYCSMETLKALYLDYDEPNEFNGNRQLSFNNIDQMLRFFSQNNRNLYKVKLMKLLWYSDALHFKENNQSISGLVYTHMPLGALPIGYDTLFQAFSNSVSVKVENLNCSDNEEIIGYKIQNLEKVDLNKLLPSEIAIMDEVNKFFIKMGSKKISGHMHEEAAYRNTAIGDLISFKLAKNLKDFK
jgi:putative zinc finger/helix-turn-helix protein, YgiT family